MFRTLLLLAVLPCAACATIIEGTSQTIAVSTNPVGASCSFMRQGRPIGTVAMTPGSAKIDKTKYDITIECEKAGFTNSSYLNKSGVAGATFGNIIAGGLSGWAVDSAVGADNKYDSAVNITLVPAATAASPVITSAVVPNS
ncbi:MAG: hypothetical protein JWM91_426 [Rhodospirillales bacterium]|nr:hypothetical protein [Rhodospirillales bacterium]